MTKTNKRIHLTVTGEVFDMMCEWRQKLFGATHDQPHRPAKISWNYFLLLVGTDAMGGSLTCPHHKLRKIRCMNCLERNYGN
jgi:hypothetical protein